MDCSPPASSIHGIFQAKYWSELPYPSPEDLPDPGIEPGSPALRRDALPSEPPGKLKCQARSWRQLGPPEIALHPRWRERWAWGTREYQSTSQDTQQVGPARGSVRQLLAPRVPEKGTHYNSRVCGRWSLPKECVHGAGGGAQ